MSRLTVFRAGSDLWSTSRIGRLMKPAKYFVRRVISRKG